MKQYLPFCMVVLWSYSAWLDHKLRRLERRIREVKEDRL